MEPAALDLLTVLKDAREALLNGDFEDVRAILSGDVCADAIAVGEKAVQG